MSLPHVLERLDALEAAHAATLYHEALQQESQIKVMNRLFALSMKAHQAKFDADFRFELAEHARSTDKNDLLLHMLKVHEIIIKQLNRDFVKHYESVVEDNVIKLRITLDEERIAQDEDRMDNHLFREALRDGDIITILKRLFDVSNTISTSTVTIEPIIGDPMSPGGYITDGNAIVAPVTIVNPGTTAPIGAAFVVHVDHINV